MHYQILKRTYYVYLGFILLFLIIILRVFYLQVFKTKDIGSLASSLWSRNLPILADRGKITDRNGVVLADNLTTTSLVVIPVQIKNKEEVATKLSEILGVSYLDIYSHLIKHTSIERIHPEGRRLSYDIAEKINNLNYDGVYLLKESKRYYPYGSLLSHVLGYVGIDNQGLSGIELEYDKYLKGSDGGVLYYSDGKGNRLKMAEVYDEPVKGNNIALTIDIKIQEAVEKELDNVVTKYNPEQALALVMDPTSGEVLAMSSRPNFDSNNYQDYDLETINRNLPIWATYEPGSTFKIITLSSAINENKVNLFEDHYYDGGSINVENARIKCWKAGGHGAETFLQVVENSCNLLVNTGTHFSFIEKEPNFQYCGKKVGYKRVGVISEDEINFLKNEVEHIIEKEKIYTPLLKETNKEIEELKKYFNPNEKNFLLRDKEDLILEENILRLGKLLYEKRFNNTNRIKFNSIKEQEIKDLTKNIKKYIFSKKNVEFQNEYKNFKKCLSEINDYFEKISKDNNIKNKRIDTTLIDSKQEYLDNYVFNAIVNHANYYYKNKKKNHINEDKIIEEIILNDYLKNKKKSRFNILKNYLSNSNPKSKFKNRYQVENAIRKINDEMEDAQKEFSKLFQNNEKDYN